MDIVKSKWNYIAKYVRQSAKPEFGVKNQIFSLSWHAMVHALKNLNLIHFWSNVYYPCIQHAFNDVEILWSHHCNDIIFT